MTDKDSESTEKMLWTAGMIALVFSVISGVLISEPLAWYWLLGGVAMLAGSIAWPHVFETNKEGTDAS